MFPRIKTRFVFGAPAAAFLAASCANPPPPPEPPRPPPAVTIRDAPADFTEITDGIAPAADIEALIAPYREQLDEQLAVVLGHAAGEFTKADPEGTLDNLVAEALLHAARRHARDTVHVSLVNEGGLRIPLAAGPILMRHAYELLPFENFVVVLSLSGARLEELADQVARTSGEPIAGWTMELDGDDAVRVRVGGEPVDPDGTYRLATVDYLVNGGGAWSVLWEVAPHGREDLDILIRTAFVEYLREHGTVSPVLDGRIRRAGDPGEEPAPHPGPRGTLTARGQNPPGIRAAMHPGLPLRFTVSRRKGNVLCQSQYTFGSYQASLCVAPRANSPAIHLSSRLASPAPRRSRCSRGFFRETLG